MQLAQQIPYYLILYIIYITYIYTIRTRYVQYDRVHCRTRSNQSGCLESFHPVYHGITISYLKFFYGRIYEIHNFYNIFTNETNKSILQAP